MIPKFLREMNPQETARILDAVAADFIPADVNLLPQIAARYKRKSLMQTLRARPIIAILVALLALLAITGAAYAIGKLTGFIPGFGFTSDAGTVYVLETPVEAVENGITLRVDKAVSDGSRFWVQVRIEGLTPEALNSPNPDSRWDGLSAYIILPNSARLQWQRGGFSTLDDAPDQAEATFIFDALPPETTELTLRLEGLPAEPNTIEIPLRLRPAQTGEVLPLQTENLPLQSDMHNGLALVLDNIASASDHTILQVSLRFKRPNTFVAGQWFVTLTDADGRAYPLKDITPQTTDSGDTRIFRTSALRGGEQLTLTLTTFPQGEILPIAVDFSAEAGGFIFDPGSNPQVGQTWALDQIVTVGGYNLHIVGARLTAPSELLFEFAPTDDVTGVMLYSTFASGAAGGMPVDGNFTAGMTFAKLPVQPFDVSVTRVYTTAHGPWQIQWRASAPDPQTANFPTSTPAPTLTPHITPTFAVSDPLLSEVQALTQKFDASLRQGPAWVHVVSENISENLQAGQQYPPPYYQSDEWYEVDAQGWVTRSLTTHRDADGQILQQGATVGAQAINFTFGDVGGGDIAPWQFSLDFITRDLADALQLGHAVMREETTCEDGSPCLLITMWETFAQPVQNPGETKAFTGGGRRMWINLQSGQQVKYQSFWKLENGIERVDFTQRFLLVQKVSTPPQDVLDILTSVVVP